MIGRAIKMYGHRTWRNLMLAALAAACMHAPAFADQTLLNVSYDPTRELYAEINSAFIKSRQQANGEVVTIKQSHGGSGTQTRAVIEGLEADVVTFALAADIDAVAARGLIAPDWQGRLPYGSVPFTSTIVFLVRKGNPRGIKDWDDLVKPDVRVVTPNPKTSGGARWNYLAAYAYARRKFGDDAKVADFLRALFANVPVLDTGARSATMSFTVRGVGDVLIAWENEALLALNHMGAGQYDIVRPSLSILAEPPVTVVDKYVRKHGTEALAKAYLDFLFTPAAQAIAVKHHYRPRVTVEGAPALPPMELVDINAHFGGWTKANNDHFKSGALFDQISRR